MVTAKKSKGAAKPARAAEKVAAHFDPELVRRVDAFAARERRSRANALEVLVARALDALDAKPLAAAAS